MTRARLLALAFPALLLMAPASVAQKSIDDELSDCRGWLRTQGPLGSYTLVACDQGALTRYFDSGLERLGPEVIRIRDPRLPPPTFFDPDIDGSIPATFETDDKAQWSRAVVTNRAAARPSIYAGAQLIDGSVIEARFPRVRMKPRSRWTLRRGRYVWRLVDRKGRTVARAPRRHIDIPPLSKPLRVSAFRQGETLTVNWFAPKEPIGTRFHVYGAAQLPGPWRLLTTFDAGGGGENVERRLQMSQGTGIVRVQATRGSRYESADPVPVQER